ncbi:hypothetical protein [Streptomyces alboflavus]|uniref:hypothetical protein n=1 Tax=Streptomyces alboflavus TaxID=67267 RepID=UPI0036A62E24
MSLLVLYVVSGPSAAGKPSWSDVLAPARDGTSTSALQARSRVDAVARHVAERGHAARQKG